MIEILKEAMAANQAEAATYSQGIQTWMKVMALSFLSSVFFVAWKSGARWILAALIVNMAGLILLRALYPDLSRTAIGTGVHLIFWTFAMFMIWRPATRNQRKRELSGTLGRTYLAWLSMVSIIMSISLVLDAKTAMSWIVG